VSFSGISWLDALDGGDGFDHLELFNSDGHISHFSLALGGSTSGAIATGFETLTYHGADNFDAVEGGANTDWIYGFGQTDTISGLGGADFLYGGDGNDIVNGGDGDDAIDGGGGDDLLRGGNGNDYVRGREGNDQISSGAGGGALHGDEGNDTIRTGSGMDRVFAGDGHDRIFEETADFVFINPHNGNSSGGDSISGGLGNDRIDAGAGNDAIAGDEGNDSLIGGAGNDTISGGIGLDTVDWSAATGNIVLDLDSNGNGAPGPVAGIGTDTVSGIENIIAGSGNDSLSGNFEWNTFTGGGGDDALDTGGGMDHLIGGTGRDRMTGGEGRDWFEFDDFDTGVTSATRDHITDFQSGIDIIYLRDIDANTATTGNDAFTFIGTSAFAANTPGTVRFQISGNNTLIEFNTDADAAAEGQIALTGIVNLTGADFFL
jgi:Ca2+-binding RTX toxin-like protein